MKIGLITYDHPHLKTEQLVSRYVESKIIEAIRIYALPFKKRPERAVLVAHRPDMADSIPTSALAELPKVTFRRWDGIENIGQECDLFIIGGAGILDVSFAAGKPIVNAHPGIIPLTRGLDSFKWAIHNDDPVGNTLHLIDNEVDKGEILQIKPTPIFSSDTIYTLARRHYESEVDMLSKVLDVIDCRVRATGQEKPATMRMNTEIESKMIAGFEQWKERRLSLNTMNSVR